jgi:beta-N-acetylhexosaminidase
MTAHIVVPALDPSGRPATLSHPILTGLLRSELGFDGVIVTDALTMQGVREEFGDDRVPVEAILAGADQMLMPPNLRVAFDGVLAAVESGEITEERIDASVRRILEQKAKRGVLGDPMVDLGAVDAAMNEAEHRAKAADIADESVTLLKNSDDVLPMAAGTKMFLTGWGGSARLQTMAQELTAHGADITVHPAQEPNTSAIAAAVAASEAHDAVVVLTQSAVFTPSTAQRSLVSALAEGEVPVVQISVRNPYDVASTAPTEGALAVYSYADVSLQAAARTLVGAVNPTGQLPVAIPAADGTGELYPFGHGLHYPVAPADVVFHDRPGRGQDGYQVPEVQGVDYLLDGRVLKPGAYRSREDVTITAVPQDGYVFVDGAVTEWASTLTTGLPTAPTS